MRTQISSVAGFSWSPNGTRIGFLRCTNVDCALWLARADGTGLHRLIGSVDHGPAWSPDSSRVTFIDDNSRVRVVGIDGRGQRTLAQGGLNLTPTWSPDGASIAYVHQPGDSLSRERIVVVSVDGGKTTRLTEVAGDPPSGLDWRP